MWVKIGSEIAWSAKGNKYGTLKVASELCASEVKFVHKSGYVSCRPGGCSVPVRWVRARMMVSVRVRARSERDGEGCMPTWHQIYPLRHLHACVVLFAQGQTALRISDAKEILISDFT